MRVNSAFAGFFTRRLCISIVLLVIIFAGSSFNEPPDADLHAKQVNLIIRKIGHQLLLQAGDSTSRVLPVTEIKEGTFLLRFEKEFGFCHDSLRMLTQDLLPKTVFPSGYTVTVHDCSKGSIVYGFQLNNTSPDILACSGRRQPPGCYNIEFAFPDFYVNIENKKANIAQRTKEVSPPKVDLQKVDPKLAKLETTFDPDIEQGIKELKSVHVDPHEMNTKDAESENTIFDNPNVYVGLFVLLVVTLLVVRSGKSLKTVPVQNQHHAIIKESVPELAALGKFFFDVKGQRLLLGSEVIILTDKECRVLELLHKDFGELIAREVLMQKVWIDEGVITGRSLDMFVSKLRKKLSGDPELRITNVHGKGYKLVLTNNGFA